MRSDGAGRPAPRDRAPTSRREAGEDDLRGALLLAQHRERAVERMAALAKLLAHRAHQQDRLAGCLEGDVLEQAQRRRVGPLQVLERDQERMAPARRRQRARDRVEQEEALGRSPREPGQELAELARAAVEELAQHLHPEPERRNALLGAIARKQHARAARGGLRGEVLDEPRLADPRGAGDQRDRAAPLDGLGEARSSRASASSRPTKSAAGSREPGGPRSPRRRGPARERRREAVARRTRS